MKLERNGIDLSLNYGKPSVIDRVGTINKWLQTEQAKNPPPEMASAGDTLRHSTRQVVMAINMIYADTHGPDICDKIFVDGEADGNEVVDLYLAIVGGIGQSREEATAARLASAQAIKARRERIAAMKEQIKALEAENADEIKADVEEAKAELRALREKPDTSVPYSDMSQRPRVPLAVPIDINSTTEQYVGQPPITYPHNG